MLYKLWMIFGIKQGWITEPFCNTHEGYLYLTEEQEAEFEEGGDPCVVIVQLIEETD
jgi:hypothetical protein